jgi:phosphohistidine phosphatase
MKTLLLLRHAKSSWNEPGLADHDRPLNKRGRKAAPRMARLLREMALRPDLVLCSTAVRAQETARLVLSEWDSPPAITTHEKLYHCEPSGFVELLRTVTEPNHVLMLIGHNPGLEEFLAQLTGQSEHLSTAAVARVDLDLTAWSQFAEVTRGKLIGLWRPRELQND